MHLKRLWRQPLKQDSDQGGVFLNDPDSSSLGWISQTDAPAAVLRRAGRGGGTNLQSIKYS